MAGVVEPARLGVRVQPVLLGHDVLDVIEDWLLVHGADAIAVARERERERLAAKLARLEDDLARPVA